MFAQNTLLILILLVSTSFACCTPPSSYNSEFGGFNGISDIQQVTGGFHRISEINDASVGFGNSEEQHQPQVDDSLSSHHWNPTGGGPPGHDKGQHHQQHHGAGAGGPGGGPGTGAAPGAASVSPRLKERFVIFNQKNVSFFEAWRLCQQVGMRLASITSAEDNNELQVVIQKTRSNGLGPWWIAGTDLGEWRKWIWITTNTPVGYRTGYLNFWPGEPNNGAGNERCINLGAHGGTAWDDFNCDWEFRYICENYI